MVASLLAFATTVFYIYIFYNLLAASLESDNFSGAVALALILLPAFIGLIYFTWRLLCKPII